MVRTSGETQTHHHGRSLFNPWSAILFADNLNTPSTSFAGFGEEFCIHLNRNVTAAKC